MITSVQLDNTLERGQKFLELIRTVNSEQRAITKSFIEQFELIDYNELRTQEDGQRRWQKQWAITYNQETGEVWQYIVESKKYARGYTYLAPSKIGNRAFFPAVPPSVRQTIAKRLGLEISKDGPFWEQVKSNKQIPILITEGGGKALSGLSHGYVTVSLYGCACLGSDDLVPYLKGRDIIIALDSDSKPSARLAVNRSLTKHLSKLVKLAKSVRVATWDSQFKGLDDLLANCGTEALDQAIKTAKHATKWLIEKDIDLATQRLEASKLKADLELEALPSVEEMQALLDEHRDVFLNAQKGLGKTELGGAIVRNAKAALLPTPLESLAKNNANEMNQGDRVVYYRTDCDKANGQLVGDSGYVTRLSFCTEAILGLKAHIEGALSKGSIVFNDELDLQLNSLATSPTHAQDGKRKINERSYWEMQIRSKNTLSVSADLDQYDAGLFERKTGRKPFSIVVKPTKKPYIADVYGDKVKVNNLLEQAIENGDRVMVCCSRKSDAKFLEWRYRDYGAVVIHRDNASDPMFEGFFDNPNQWLEQHQIKVLIVSPVLRSGFSITGDFFDKVFCFFEADSISASTALQLSERYRRPVPRVIYAARTNHQYNHTTPKEILRASKLRAKATSNDEIEFIDEHDPYYHYKANDNWSKAHFAGDIIARLQVEVEQVNVHWASWCQVDAVDLQQYQDLRKTFKHWQNQQKVDAANWDRATYEANKDRQNLLESELLARQKFELADWSDRTPDVVTLAQVERDNNGKKRKALERLERQAYPTLAGKSDKFSRDVQAKWNCGIAHQDLTHYALTQRVLEGLGLHEFLDYALSGNSWHKDTPIVVELATKLRNSRNFKETSSKLKALITDQLAQVGIHLTCGKDSSNTAYIGSLLKWLGLTTLRTQNRIDGKVVNSYELCPDDLEITRDELTRRATRNIREGLDLKPSHTFVSKLVSDVSHTLCNSQLHEVCDSLENTAELMSPPPINTPIQKVCDNLEAIPDKAFQGQKKPTQIEQVGVEDAIAAEKAKTPKGTAEKAHKFEIGQLVKLAFVGICKVVEHLGHGTYKVIDKHGYDYNTSDLEPVPG